jgi:hypothetical protein
MPLCSVTCINAFEANYSIGGTGSLDGGGAR